jgi:hypothetical protein
MMPQISPVNNYSRFESDQKEMAMNENPEAFPGTGSGNAGFVPADIPLSSTAQQFLNQTKPWVRFMSVMIFISSAFMALAGIALIMLGIGTSALYGTRGPFGSLARGGNIAAGFFYIILAILYMAPGVFLSRFASAIKLLQTSRSAQALEDALRYQKSFWRYVGILTIIGMVLMVVGVMLLVVVAVFNMNR